MIHQINNFTGILRARGGSSLLRNSRSVPELYSPRTRR